MITEVIFGALTLAIVAVVAVKKRYLDKDYLAELDPKFIRPKNHGKGLFGIVPLMSPHFYLSFHNLSTLNGSPVIASILGETHIYTADPDHAKALVQSPAAKNKGGPGYDRVREFLGQETLLALPYKEWVPLRRTMASTFQFKNMKLFFDYYVSSTQEFLDNVAKEQNKYVEEREAKIKEGKFVAPTYNKPSIEVDALTTKLTMDVVVKVLFSKDMQSQQGVQGPFIQKLSEASDLFCEANSFPAWSWFHPIKNRYYFKLLRGLRAIVRDIIEERTAIPDVANRPEKDLLDLLIEARDPETGRAMTTEELISQCFTFFFAGHDTGAHTTSWALHEIATHPEVQNKIYAELMEVVGDDRTTFTYEELQKMVYLTQVLKEVLRIHPPVANVNRLIEGDFSFPGGPKVPEKTVGVIQLSALHFNQDIWGDPWAFRPERFSEEESKDRHPYAWGPFMFGERNCLGMHFAMQEIKTILALTLLRYQVSADLFRPPASASKVTLVPANGIYLHFFERNNK